MAHTEPQKKLLKVLNEIFQLDRSDLDFGIYRIMNTKSKEINEFLENDLISSISLAFSKSENKAEQNELDELKAKDTVSQYINGDKNTKKAFESLEDVKRYILLNKKLSTISTSSSLENEVFSHLTTFFKRYYKDGDFVSLRRYKKDTYAIPYEGEEVKLHWANSDQYYIKSGEYFRDYSFKTNNTTIHFKLSDAETEQNNNKSTGNKERRFVILEETPCKVINDELYIHFEYKAVGKEKQDTLNEKAIAKAIKNIENLEFLKALNTLAPTEKNKNRTVFEKHLKSYTSRNSFDYFIHKNLGEFLIRELDFYIKNEMVFLDDIMDSPIKYDEVINKVKIFKEVAKKIIAFLSQLEELQKKLWEKKKFIIETNYCITLDKIDETHYKKIFACKEQLAEWKELFNIDVKNIDNLKEQKYLVLDTKFFDSEFKYSLLSKFDNLDENIDGVLINSENFGALNLLQNRYKEQIKTVYIDPPYNTNSSPIAYKNGYKDSSWLSLLENRLYLTRKFLNDDGILEIAIDDTESNNLKLLLDNVFSQENYISQITVICNPQGRVANNVSKISDFHYLYAQNINNIDNITIIKKDANKSETPLKRTGTNSRRYERPKRHYPILYKDNQLSTITQDEYEKIYNKETKKFDDFFIDQLKINYEAEGYEFILPLLNDGEGVVWQRTYERVLNEINTYIYKNGSIYTPPLSEEVIKTCLISNLYSNPKYGTELVKDMFNQSFSKNTPKSIYTLQDFLILNEKHNQIILDFFAGSGTTGHAVINLNREDKGKRKYILVEMGEYFNSVTKPRIQKAIYTDNWKDGKPQDKNGISQMFKYFKLESYEDTLNNLEFKKTKAQQSLELIPQAKEDYILNYSLGVESKNSLLNIDTFSTPFNYTLNIATSNVGETKATTIDLVETFNYLLGLVVKRIELSNGYLIVEGQTLKNEKILIIWRNGQTNDTLNEFFIEMEWSVKTSEFDTIYVNGDNNLDNLRKDEDHFKVKLIEQEFKKLMFGE